MCCINSPILSHLFDVAYWIGVAAALLREADFVRGNDSMHLSQVSAN